MMFAHIAYFKFYYLFSLNFPFFHYKIINNQRIPDSNYAEIFGLSRNRALLKMGYLWILVWNFFIWASDDGRGYAKSVLLYG